VEIAKVVLVNLWEIRKIRGIFNVFTNKASPFGRGKK
jgi:hypothetical protein